MATLLPWEKQNEWKQKSWEKERGIRSVRKEVVNNIFTSKLANEAQINNPYVR